MTSPEGIKAQLADLRRRVLDGQIGSAEPWGGADVAIVESLPQRSEAGFYPDPLFVRTIFAKQLSWLFIELRDSFGTAIDFDNKFEFYGRLAQASIRYCDRMNDDEELEGLLLAVLDEADQAAERVH